MEIHARGIRKNFGSFTALDGVDLDIESGELIALLGPSGSGKTTLLRVIAGLEYADHGQILFAGDDMAQVPVRERQVGFVFQHYALFKHMTVLDNVSFGLQVRKKDKPGKEAIRQRALELLDLVQLGGLEKRYPSQLSGGQRQRVALARALAIDPKVLLLDEPFGALDAKVRKDLRRWLRELHNKTGYTTIFVTHDQEEALELADRVVIMNRGAIEQVGTVDQVYEYPASPFVFDFLGGTNVVEAELHGGRILRGATEIAKLADTDHPNGAIDVYVRPGDMRVAEPEQAGVDVVLTQVQRTGPIVRASAQLIGSKQILGIELPHLHHDVPRLRTGERLRLRLMQFSVYPTTTRLPQQSSIDVPTLIGRERTRGRLGA